MNPFTDKIACLLKAVDRIRLLKSLNIAAILWQLLLLLLLARKKNWNNKLYYKVQTLVSPAIGATLQTFLDLSVLIMELFPTFG